MKQKFLRSALVSAVVAVSLGGVASYAADATCASGTSGGEWSMDGLDVQGSRNQTAEDQISTENVTSLEPKWALDLAAIGGTGGAIQTAPIVAEGCVYLQIATGTTPRIVALNADSGAVVWTHALAAAGSMSAPTVKDGILYAYEPTSQAATGKGPHVLALDSQTGAEIYSGEGICGEAGCANNAGAVASPVLFNGLIWLGITNTEQDGSRVGGFAIVDATDGSLLHREWTVPDDQAALGFGGCSIWTAPSFDPDTNYGYVGTGQPSTWSGKESERCNALVKFDMDPTRDTFGQIVGAAKGTSDDAPYIDVDFGSGTTLYRDADGRQIVAAIQKSGWVHAAYTKHMTRAWDTPLLGIGSPVGAYTKLANDGSDVYAVGALGSPMARLDGTTGTPEWVSPVVAPAAQGNVAYANGVIFFNDEVGVLIGRDSSNGVPLFVRPMKADGAACTASTAGGVVVARHKVISACGPVVAAYGLPAA